MSKLTKEEVESLKQSINEAEKILEKNLLLPKDASQLRMMIAYYEQKIKEAESEEVQE